MEDPLEKTEDDSYFRAGINLTCRLFHIHRVLAFKTDEPTNQSLGLLGRTSNEA